MKAFVVIAGFVSIAAILALLGCERPNSIHAFEAMLPDGRHVACVTFYTHAISCDWEHAGEPRELP